MDNKYTSDPPELYGAAGEDIGLLRSCSMSWHMCPVMEDPGSNNTHVGRSIKYTKGMRMILKKTVKSLKYIKI